MNSLAEFNIGRRTVHGEYVQLVASQADRNLAGFDVVSYLNRIILRDYLKLFREGLSMTYREIICGRGKLTGAYVCKIMFQAVILIN